MDSRLFAIEKHAGQKYGEYDYVYHLDQVFANVGQFLDNNPESLKIRDLCYLHDVIEDTKKNNPSIEDEISKNFGEDVLDWVQKITDCEGKNRKERKLLTNEKLSAVKDSAVLIVKLSDRICNIREGYFTKNYNKLDMYKKEHVDFMNAVWRSQFDRFDNLRSFKIEMSYKLGLLSEEDSLNEYNRISW